MVRPGRIATAETTTSLAFSTEPPAVWASVQLVESLEVSHRTHALANSNWQNSDRDYRVIVTTIISAGEHIRKNIPADATSAIMRDGNSYSHAKIALSRLVAHAIITTAGLEVSLGGMNTILVTSGANLMETLRRRRARNSVPVSASGQ